MNDPSKSNELVFPVKKPKQFLLQLRAAFIVSALISHATARADVLQGSAISSGVSVSLTVASSTFSGTRAGQASALVSAGVQSQGTSPVGSLFS
jgi:hypothetical protein